MVIISGFHQIFLVLLPRHMVLAPLKLGVTAWLFLPNEMQIEEILRASTWSATSPFPALVIMEACVKLSFHQPKSLSELGWSMPPFQSVMNMWLEWEINLYCFTQLRFCSCYYSITSPPWPTHYVPGTHVGAIHVLTHSLLTTTLWNKYYHQSHVTMQWLTHSKVKSLSWDRRASKEQR